MKKELEVLTDIYSPNGKLLKRDVSYMKIFETDSIELENYIDDKGKVIMKYSDVSYQDKHYKVNLPYDELKGYIVPLVIKGLMDKSIYHEKAQIKTYKSTKSVRRR